MGVKLVLALVACMGCRQVFGIDEDVTFGDCMFRDIATGREHTCMIDRGGAVWCWGKNDQGNVQPGGPALVLEPANVELPRPAVQIGTGRDSTCARTESGDVWCWGDNSWGQHGLGTADGSTGPVQVALGGARAIDLAIGGHHACIRRESDQAIVCWGRNSFMQAGQPVATSVAPNEVPNTSGARALAVGHNHNCIIDASGRTMCWGRNNGGQLGDTGPDRAQPTQITGLAAVTALAAGGRHSCAVDDAGNVYCWGEGTNGQLGRGVFYSEPLPTTTAIGNAASIAASALGTCALLKNGEVACWGNVDAGAGKAPETTGVPVMASISGAVQLSASFFHACARTPTGALCWGANESGQLGRGMRSGSETLVPVTLPAAIERLDTTFDRACAVTTTQELYCWGSAPIGDGTRSTAMSPTKIPVGLAFVSGVALDRQFSCAWGGANAVCWGANDRGQLGNGTTMPAIMPINVQPNGGITKVATGGGHACGIVSGGVKCWGRGTFGQLGNSARQDSPLPVAAGTLTGVTDVAAGGTWHEGAGGHSCAIASGTVYCWGDNSSGQVGDNSTTPRDAPTPVNSTITSWAQLSLGSRHSCARTTAGDVYCWGANADGELGLGNKSQQNRPIKLSLPAAATWLGARGQCAALTTGDVYCWGPSKPVEAVGTAPVPIPNFQGATTLSLVGDGGCTLIGDAVSCWGDQLLLGAGDVSASVPTPPNLSCN